MADWEIRANYDYRFGALMLSVKYGDELSPIYHIRLSDLLRDVPKHELENYMTIASKPPVVEANLDEIREKAIKKLDLKGKVVLDIGGYDGAMAKIALDSGANRAIVLDNHQYEHYGWEDKKFEGVEYRQGDLFSWGIPSDEMGCPNNQGQVDTIIFYNVLYHLKNPWAALDRLRELIKPDGTMLLCTLHRFHDGAWMYLYEPRECNPSDETVYFGPSIDAIERLLELTGWDYKQEGIAADRVVYTCTPTPGWERKHEDS